jgi:signal transduction histidine kinase
MSDQSSPRPASRLASASLGDLRRLLPYIAALELEVDRLRRHNHLVQQEVWATVCKIRQLCMDASGPDSPPIPVAEVGRVVDGLAEVLRDLQELPGYHPAHDQVVVIAIRPLVEQVFRWQQRLHGAPQVVLRLELETEHIEWFPARLRHILDNLISNALKYRDPDKTESWVRLGLRASAEGYEFRVSDNGIGMPSEERNQLLELFYRAVPTRTAGLGVGLAVVKLLVEQSGGSLTVDSGEGQGTTFVVVLPPYDVNDYLL